MATLVWIIGCGYTGRRVAQRLLDTGMPVVATTRNPDSLRDLAAQGVEVLRWDASDPDGFEILKAAITPGAGVLLSVPTLRGPHGPDDPTPRIVQALGDAPARVVYLSTTGVYGDAREVDESTPAAPVTERQRLRVEAEQAVAEGPWPSLALRPAAIYGPGRGVHVAMREGLFQLANDGSNFVSRIHVDDLATHAGHSLLSDLTGAYPVADEEPCSSREMAEFCANLLGLPLPESVAKEKLSETRRSDRRVDGSAIRRLLGIELRYPSYKQGIPAALKEEADLDESGH
jgi:nucleoside-diphosphate-sugar epimerase